MSETIFDSLNRRLKTSPQQAAIQFKDNDKWINYTWADYFNLVEAIGSGLIQLGVEPGDSVAIMSETRPEWIISDMAIMGVHGITVPIYPNNLAEDVEFILNDSKVKIIILENESQLEKWSRIRPNCPQIRDVVVLKPGSEKVKDYVSWIELLNKGREALRANTNLFKSKIITVNIENVATIIYTSGTTGRPKGVVLTHKQISSELEDAFALLPVNENDLSLTFLPFSHIFGRVEAWGSIYAGYTLAFAESIDKLKQNLREVQPTFLVAVPRIFEKIYAGILAGLENQKTKSKIFHLAQSVGMKISEKIQCRQSPSLLLMAEYSVMKALVFRKVLNALGGRMRFAVAGGAPTSPEILRFFHSVGLLICEGYGLSETTAGISFNSPIHYRFGSVGKPLKDVELKFAADGEILVKSDKIMKEYFNNPEATAAAFTDGFFHTGDIGHLDADGFLYITDRKKDLIKTAGGKYVAPQKIEGLLKMNPYVSNVLVHGDQKKYIIALITLNEPYRDQHSDPQMMAQIRDVVAEVNSQLASFESIKKFAILPNDFTIETGELTPSLKVKRRFCDQKYEKEISSLYN